MVLVDLENAFDHIPREVVWGALRRKGVMEREVFAITVMYKNIKTRVKIDDKRLKEFEVKVGVHRDSVLSSLLLAMVMDKITKDTRIDGEEELCMLKFGVASR